MKASIVAWPVTAQAGTSMSAAMTLDAPTLDMDRRGFTDRIRILNPGP